jgi:hypothetical protein
MILGLAVTARVREERPEEQALGKEEAGREEKRANERRASKTPGTAHQPSTGRRDSGDVVDFGLTARTAGVDACSARVRDPIAEENTVWRGLLPKG